MLQEVGINAKVRLLEYSVRAQKLRQKALEGLLLGDPTSTLLDPDGMFWRLMQPGGILDYWRHPEWDRLMGEARVLQDPHKRHEAYKKAAEIFLDEVPVLIVLQRLTAGKNLCPEEGSAMEGPERRDCRGL